MTMPSRTLMLILGIAAIILLAMAVPSCIQKWRSQGAQSRVDRGQAEAGTNTGSAALNTLEGVVANDAATDAAVGTGIGSTRGVPEAQRDAVAIDALCQFKSAKDKPECKK